MRLINLRSPAKIAFAAIGFLGLVACGSSGKKEKFAYVERPVETLYSNGTDALERNRYDRAIAFFEEVERQHPYSAWARRAQLMKAFAHYQGNDYEDSLTAIEQFLALHPGNKSAPYAYYLRAINHYERIRDVGRDQEFTNKAVTALTDVVRRYPDSEYARDARLKLDLTYDHLAGKEMAIGRFYLRDNKHIAAINRFNRVITKYETTSHVPEALHRTVEAYLELGIIEEARAAAAALSYNYPGSRWYEDTYKLFDRRDLVTADASLRKRNQGYKPKKKDVDPNKALRDIDPKSLIDITPPTAEELESISAGSASPDIDATIEDGAL